MFIASPMLEILTQIEIKLNWFPMMPFYSCTNNLNALVLFSLITSEIFQLTHRYRYQFVGEVMTDM